MDISRHQFCGIKYVIVNLFVFGVYFITASCGRLLKLGHCQHYSCIKDRKKWVCYAISTFSFLTVWGDKLLTSAILFEGSYHPQWYCVLSNSKGLRVIVFKLDRNWLYELGINLKFYQNLRNKYWVPAAVLWWSRMASFSWGQVVCSYSYCPFMI